MVPLAELHMPEDFTDPKHFMALAGRHLGRVQEAWSEPDWSDLSTYGLYCLEALVRAAQLHLGRTPSNKHWEKAKEAEHLHSDHNLPDIGELMRQLNTARKVHAYGDAEFEDDTLDAHDVAALVEEYFEAVRKLIGGA
jgi:hypothetical protein